MNSIFSHRDEVDRYSTQDETYCKHCGGLSTSNKNCTYCGVPIDSPVQVNHHSTRSKRIALMESRWITKALDSSSKSLGKGEVVMEALANNFSLIAKIRNLFDIPAVVVSLTFALIPFLLQEFFGISIFDVRLGYEFFFASLLPVFGAVIPLLMTAYYGVEISNYEYILTNNRIEVYKGKATYLSSIWLAQVKSIVEISAKARRLNTFEAILFSNTELEGLQTGDKVATFRGIIRRLKMQAGHLNSSQFSRNSLIMVDAQKGAELVAQARKFVSPRCSFFRYQSGIMQNENTFA